MFKNKNKTTTEKHSSHSQQITHSQTNRTVLRTSAHCRSLVLEHTTSNATLNPHHHSLAQARILNLAAKCKKNNKKTKRQKTSMCLKTKNRKAQQPFSEIPPPSTSHPPPPGDDDVRAVATCGERPADIAAAVFQCQRDAIRYQRSGTDADQTAPVTSALSRPAATT